MSNRPVTKREQYLAKAAGITSGSTPPAVTRTEHFLKAIADGTGYQSLPTAVTKEEQYLKAMTGAPIGNAFFVWHSSVKGGGTNGMPERVTITDEILENGYDLTSHIPYGTLYGGYALDSGVTRTDDAYNGSNWTWTEMQTANGKTLHPVAGETYCIKEIPWGWLKATNSFAKSKATSAILFSSIDDQNYDDVGFYVCNELPKTDEGYVRRKLSVVNPEGRWHDWDTYIGSYTVASLFGNSYGISGGYLFAIYLASQYGLPEDNVFFVDNGLVSIIPYAITKDGLEIKSTETWGWVLRDRSTSASTGYYVKSFDIAFPTEYVPPEPEPEEEEEET